ncbi:MAG: hybrid sensor histidine kinase/response regulator [Gemmatimonadales bacterium]|nr:MAG: hybrid sensor histidine kinase/response regulator [Gemmatimonadales bacterium]
MIDSAALRRLTEFSRSLLTAREEQQVVVRLGEALLASFADSVVATALFDKNRAILVPHPIRGARQATTAAPLEAALVGPIESGTAEGTWLAAPLSVNGNPLATAAVLIRGRPVGAADRALVAAYLETASLAVEQLRREAAHEDARRSWERMVDAVPYALCLVDAQGRARRANRAFADLVHAPTTAIAGRPWLALVPPAWGEGLAAALASPGSGGEVQLRAGPRTFAVSAYPIGHVPGDAVLVFDDQTDQRRLQDQLIQSEKMSAIGQLIAGIAHDLNNPLASVIGFADFLLEGRDVPPPLVEPIRVIQQEAERAANIVRNLLTFARKQDHARRPTELGPLLNATLTLLRTQMVSRRVEVLLDLEEGLPIIDADVGQVQQVFVNLINNAAHAIESAGRAGRVVIRARPWRDGVAVEVSDDGPGMTPEVAAQVFEPFFTTKPEGQGTGLGLSISQGIVKEHGGRIVLSTAPDRGARFTVELPRSSRAAVVPPPIPETTSTPPLKILVIDDEPHILHYMRATLEAWGHGVEVAGDGQEGLALAADGDFDLIVSDLRMPRLTGREFFEALKERNPEAASRVVFSTGDTVHGDTTAFLESQAHPFLNKPFSLAELRALLAHAAPVPPA